DPQITDHQDLGDLVPAEDQPTPHDHSRGRERQIDRVGPPRRISRGTQSRASAMPALSARTEIVAPRALSITCSPSKNHPLGPSRYAGASQPTKLARGKCTHQDHRSRT